MTITFESTTQEATFHDPREDFDRVTVPVDVRMDPLTGRQTRIVPEALPRPEDPDFAPFVDETGFCFFCPDNVADVTPTYADHDGPDRGRRGEAVSFPNISPYGTHSNVVVLTADHYVPIDQLDAAIYTDGFGVALEYVRAVLSADPDTTLASINQNYLPPAGSSIVHPHLQSVVDDRGSTAHRRMAEAARTYRDANDRSYWTTLIEAERDDGERYLGSTGGVDWIAAFAPKHFYHVIGVLDQGGVPAPDDDVVSAVSRGLENVLAYYAAEDLNSFNVSWLLSDENPAVPSTIHVVARSIFDAYYVSDAPFFTTIHDEAVVDVSPEALADDAREYF